MTQAKKDIFAQKAKLSLNFVIVGGGIAGLACAFTLQSAGHTVRVFEKTDGTEKVTGGMRSPPNMTRLLKRWGLGEKLEDISTISTHLALKLGTTAEHICNVYLHKEVMRELQANLLLVQYSDLYKIMYDLAIESGARINFNSEVMSVDPHGPSVLLSSGEKVNADIVIGADGGEGLVRGVIVGKREAYEAGPFSSYAFCIPTELVEQDEELKELLLQDSWNLFLADGRAIQTSFAGGGRQLAILYTINDTKLEAKPGWNNLSLLSGLDLSAFDPRLQRLMNLVPYAHLVKHVVQESLESWYHSSNKVLILGDAAHLTPPGSLHCAATAVEDATVLGSLFSHLSSQLQVPHFLSAFQDLRQARCQTVMTSEWGKAEFISLPAGEMQEMRDSQLREQGFKDLNMEDLDEVPEHLLRQQIEEHKELFGYDAHDDADDWWVVWGTLLERSMLLHSELHGDIYDDK